MAQFISKLQYKTCEKGEFFDEQPRKLDETLQLIKVFPWNEQRGTDIQLSGPGVVIEGEAGDYLKVALYFNGKFSAYYLDAANHLYEYHTDDLNNELLMVKAFFEDSLNLDDFEKHFFNIGNRSHFTTASFEYPVQTWATKLIAAFVGICSILLVITLITMGYILLGIMSLLFLVFIFFVIFFNYLINQKMYMKISKGHDEFSYGKDREHIQFYNKNNVLELLIYARRGKSVSYDAAYIKFKDGSSLNISDHLISTPKLMSKFNENLVRVEWASGWGVFSNWKK